MSPKKPVPAVPAKLEPASGLKKIGVGVVITNGKPAMFAHETEIRHFPEGCSWRWAVVMDEKFLEVVNAKGKVVYQAKAMFVQEVFGPGYVDPLKVTTLYGGGE